MKWLILLVLLFILLAIIASRYRPQIENILYVWRVLKKMNQGRSTASENKQFEREDNAKDLPLIKCTVCGVWTPEKNAFRLSSNGFYCSKDCLEMSVKTR